MTAAATIREQTRLDFELERARVRNVVAAYRGLGPAAAYGADQAAKVLKRADAAAALGTLAELIRSLKEMQGCK